MKKKCLSLLLVFGALVFSGCSNKNKEKITGIWKLDTMEINGTNLSGSSLGNWLWEFNDEGGFLINVAGEVEKGVYSIDKTSLNLKSITNKDKPDRTYTVERLDSAVLNITARTEQNKSTLHFVKLK